MGSGLVKDDFKGISAAPGKSDDARAVYNQTMSASGGSQDSSWQPEPGAPPGSGPADPAGKALQHVSEGARLLTQQTGKSG
jgi:hypothetical protein